MTTTKTAQQALADTLWRISIGVEMYQALEYYCAQGLALRIGIRKEIGKDFDAAFKNAFFEYIKQEQKIDVLCHIILIARKDFDFLNIPVGCDFYETIGGIFAERIHLSSKKVERYFFINSDGFATLKNPNQWLRKK